MDQLSIIDLTRPLDDSLSIYRSESYVDPPFRCTEWCSVPDRGFRVSRVELGTQTGTHIDAPAHFAAGGATLDSLPIETLMGKYFLLDLPDICNRAILNELTRTYRGEPILFLRTGPCITARMTGDGLDYLTDLSTRVWVLGGAVTVDDAPALEFYRRIAQAGIFLVEDLEEAATERVPRQGEIFVLPLRLVGTSGSPCRVVVRAAVHEDIQTGLTP